VTAASKLFIELFPGANRFFVFAGFGSGQQIGFAIATIVFINETWCTPLAELAMPSLFDLSKEIILITGASLGLGRQFRQRRLGALRI
jgi:hypothetical protein